jgi:hypothetical protein
MTAKPKLPRPVVALGLSKESAVTVTSLARHYVDCMTGNTYFPSPLPSLSTISAQIAVVLSKYNLSLTKARGSSEALETELRKLRIMLKLLAAYVENIARENDVGLAGAIILGSGMNIKNAAGRLNNTFEVKAGDAPGTAKISTRAQYDSVYLFHMTTDPNNATSWETIHISNRVKFIKSGLQIGIRYYFRVAVITKGEQGNWSPVVSIILS